MFEVIHECSELTQILKCNSVFVLTVKLEGRLKIRLDLIFSLESERIEQCEEILIILSHYLM